MSPVYHPISQKQVVAAKKSLPHALLIEGPKGIGIRTAALDIAGSQLADIIFPTAASGEIDRHKGSVRIEQIRALYEASRGKSSKSRVFIIDNADSMTLPSQHAFLKLLEEPPSNTHFILTAHDTSQLLPTVRSRVQRIHLQPLTPKQTNTYLSQYVQLNARERQQVLFLAAGLPADMTRLSTNGELLAQQGQLINDARTLLQGPAAEKLAIVHRYHTDRAATLSLLAAAERIIKHSITQSASRQLIEHADMIATIHERIAANGNVRIQLLLIVV